MAASGSMMPYAFAPLAHAPQQGHRVVLTEDPAAPRILIYAET
jgi:hypothetical protein